jgi:hypothetical protein
MIRSVDVTRAYASRLFKVNIDTTDHLIEVCFVDAEDAQALMDVLEKATSMWVLE